MNFGEKVPSKTEVSGIVKIITDKTCIELFDEESITLEKAKQIAYAGGHRYNVIYVFAEGSRHGEIYIYGNHGNFWEYHGKTQGYA